MRIRRFEISGYRSLQDTVVTEMLSQNIFHGDNDTGKSNILRALELIFRSKKSSKEMDIDETDSKTIQISRTEPFWRGVIENISDDFYMRGEKPITFKVLVDLSPENLSILDKNGILDSIHDIGHQFHILLTGKIERQIDDGIFSLEEISFNKEIAMRREGTRTLWLPNHTGKSEVKQSVVESVLDLFSNDVQIIPASRYLKQETYSDKTVELHSSDFKNWLHNLSLSETGYITYRKIVDLFNREPIKLGEISFLRSENHLDVMIEDDHHGRMRIDEKGTGIQQLLVLLGYIVQSSASVLCIEEPELNLSFRNQDLIVNILKEEIQNDESNLEQVIVTSHSDHIGSREDLRCFHVEKENATDTKVREFTATDRNTLFPRRIII